jgi:hypothetical protein
VRALSEHPRVATTLAAGLIVLALAGVSAGRTLDGPQPVHRSDRAMRMAGTQVAQLRQQLQTSDAQGAQLRGQVATLTAELARTGQSHQPAATGRQAKRRTAPH